MTAFSIATGILSPQGPAVLHLIHPLEILRRASDRPLPILLHSDRPLEELRARAASGGADGVVHKEPECAGLARAVSDAIRRAKSP